MLSIHSLRQKITLRLLALILTLATMPASPWLAAQPVAADDDDEEQVRIVSPRPGQVVSGPTVRVEWAAKKIEMVPAAKARRRTQRHAHVLLDQNAALYVRTARPIPAGNSRIVHTTSHVVELHDVAPGTHRIDLIIGFADHRAAPKLATSVTFRVAAGGATVPAPNPAPATGASARIAGYAYHPDPIVVPVGTSVTWTNQDLDPHTVTSEDFAGPLPAWTSPRLERGQAYSRRFTQPGTYRYYCEPHPEMRGEIIVQ